jgi:hypothetical protein
MTFFHRLLNELRPAGLNAKRPIGGIQTGSIAAAGG